MNKHGAKMEVLGSTSDRSGAPVDWPDPENRLRLVHYAQSDLDVGFVQQKKTQGTHEIPPRH
jgi:hypothetical protein